MTDPDDAVKFRRMIVTQLIHQFADPSSEQTNRWKIVNVAETSSYTYVVFSVDYVHVGLPGQSPYRTNSVQFRIGDAGAFMPPAGEQYPAHSHTYGIGSCAICGAPGVGSSKEQYPSHSHTYGIGKCEICGAPGVASSRLEDV